MVARRDPRCARGTAPARCSQVRRPRVTARHPTRSRRRPARPGRRAPTPPRSAATCRTTRRTPARPPSRRARPGGRGSSVHELAGPSGCRQSAPGCQRHHWVQSPRCTGPRVCVNTWEPGTSSSGSAPGKSAASSSFSGTVTWSVSATKRANSALVTGCRSNQTPRDLDLADRRLLGVVAGAPDRVRTAGHEHHRVPRDRQRRLVRTLVHELSPWPGQRGTRARDRGRGRHRR